MEQSDWLILGVGPLATISRASVPIISENENNSYIFIEFPLDQILYYNYIFVNICMPINMTMN